LREGDHKSAPPHDITVSEFDFEFVHSCIHSRGPCMHPFIYSCMHAHTKSGVKRTLSTRCCERYEEHLDCLHTRAHIRIHTYTHKHIHTYTHTYTHTHIHTYTHTHIQPGMEQAIEAKSPSLVAVIDALSPQLLPDDVPYRSAPLPSPLLTFLPRDEVCVRVCVCIDVCMCMHVYATFVCMYVYVCIAFVRMGHTDYVCMYLNTYSCGMQA
jgi:hypothetical protein